MFRTLAATILALLAATATAQECPTLDSKMDAITDFIKEHYGLAFSMISTPREGPTFFHVDFWLYDERETACEGTVRVSDECAVSDVEIECSTGTAG